MDRFHRLRRQAAAKIDQLGKRRSHDHFHVFRLFDDIASILGNLQHEKAQAFPQEALDLLAARTEARKAKDWARADAIREQLKALGYGVEDTKEGAKLKAL